GPAPIFSTLSLHDALPILLHRLVFRWKELEGDGRTHALFGDGIADPVVQLLDRHGGSLVSTVVYSFMRRRGIRLQQPRSPRARRLRLSSAQSRCRSGGCEYTRSRCERATRAAR